jgi:hypothetical protein
VLLLRGPQTPGELRGRTERLHRFEEIADVLAALQKLMERTPPLAAVLPRQPGTKESRYAHLLSGGVESIPVAAAEPAFARREAGEDSGLSAESVERITQLEATVTELRQEVAAMRQKIDDLLG